MKQNVIVTLADENFIDQAKQLFSSIHWNAGWRGDYLLLAHNIPEKKLRWFREKGIHIKKCEVLESTLVGKYLCPPIRLAKMNIFKTYFKRWNKIIFLDGDIIVRSSLDNLLKEKGFSACSEGLKLHAHFTKKSEKLYSELGKKFNLKGPSFNSGVLCFDSDLIKKETYDDILRLFNKYKEIHTFADQPTLNLYFYKKINYLPQLYNLPVSNLINHLNFKPTQIRGIILHFIVNKPWIKENPFYDEWKKNLEKAETIDLNKRPKARKIWANEEISIYCDYLRKRRIISLPYYVLYKIKYAIDKYIGLLGLFLQKRLPGIYTILKRRK